MSLAVLICDDSNFARKQVAKALPENWKVDITYASNGKEAVAAIAAGQAEVLFLDLTMPEMDGYEVLKHIKANDLHCLVIVISGDIQPEAIEKVKRLGAIDFIKKPVDRARLVKTLESYGILS